MTNEALRELIKSPAVAKQLLSKLTKISQGIQVVEIQTANGRTRKLRAARLVKQGDKLRVSRESD
ncbi:hypothetical protein Q31b_42420 [Novipirellula aureliae]|uniref:Uncharacterized protein n=1 Tax=Novipirellula aureliae TaxID=2527966 RepID=A0A5C6DTA6_9BACT|nr:hypothetical protein Q31b_42420 [Novipirellula aureliae]